MTSSESTMNQSTIYPKEMITMRRKDPIPDDDENDNPILKAKIISNQLRNIDEQIIPYDEYKNLLNIEREYEQQIQAQQTIDEIAEFEQKNFGKAHVPKRLDIIPLDKDTKRTLDQFKRSKETEQYGCCPPKIRAKSVFSNGRVVTQPPLWNVLDEPLLLSKQISIGPSKTHQTAFTIQHVTNSNKYGIPIYNKRMQNINKQKMNQFENKLRYLNTCSNKTHEDAIKSIIQKDRNKQLEKRERRVQNCAKIGQEWALKQLGSLQPKETHDEDIISPEDQDAINELRIRDDELSKQYNKRRKEVAASS